MTASFSMLVDQVVLPHGISGEHSNPCIKHAPCPTVTYLSRNANRTTLHFGILVVSRIWPTSFHCVLNITDALTKEVGNFHSMQLLANSLSVNPALHAYALQFLNQFVFALQGRNLSGKEINGFP